MMYDRIEYAEQEWGGKTVSLFWDMRQECLPKHLRLEVNPNDPGLSKEKQNHYRLTGQPIMMSKMFKYYDNPFDRACWAQEEVQGLEGMMS
jgi:hypothetical protein